MRPLRLLVAVAITVAAAGCKRQPAGGPAPSTSSASSAASSSASSATPAADPAAFRPSTLPRIDVHTHIGPGGSPRAMAMLRGQHVVHAVNLSGGPPGRGLEEALAEAASTSGRVTVFTNPAWRECARPGYGERMAALLERARSLGARGVKISKGLGLGYQGPDGRLLPVDDPGLDPLFEAAGRLGMPVSIHSGDPKAFWLPPTPVNERYDELVVHPGWSFYGEPVPSWGALFAQFERRVARHPKTTIVGVHFGNDPEDPDKVAELLGRYPNLLIDTAARIPEIGRHDPAKMRAFFVKFQDRVMFGTDAGFGPEPDDLMLGSTGADPPTPAEIERFWTQTWRYFETDDRKMLHPTPIQGRWTIDGVKLPREVLEKVYARNGQRLLGLATLPTD